MAHIIQFKRGSSTGATSANLVLHAGEIGVETDTGKFKVGDGTTSWNSLSYGGLQGNDGGPVPVGGVLNQVIRKLSSTDFDVEWTDSPVFVDITADSMTADSVIIGNYTISYNSSDQSLDFTYGA